MDTVTKSKRTKQPCFARITEAAESIVQQLNPCAFTLWRWARRKCAPNVPFEVNLSEFMDSFGYRSMRWIKQALNELIQLSLIEIIIQGGGKWRHILRLKVFEIGHKPDQNDHDPDLNLQDSNQSCHDTSKKQPSNPHEITIALTENSEDFRENNSSDVAHLEEFSEPESEPIGLDPTAVNNKPEPAQPIGADNFSAAPQSEILKKVAEAIAPCPLNLGIVGTVQNADEQTVLDAIEVLKERQKRRTVRNPAGYLLDAIISQWKLPAQPSIPILPVFEPSDWQRESAEFFRKLHENF